MVGQIGLGLLWLTGLIMVWTRWGGPQNLPGTFWMKFGLVVLLTGVDQVWLGWGTARQRAITTMTVDEAEKHLADGEFPRGSMGPKVTAAIRFVRSGGQRVVITSLTRVLDGLAGRAGTSVVPGRVPAGAERPR